MVELVDAIDSKSIIGNYVWVRVPPSAPVRVHFELFFCCKFFIDEKFKLRLAICMSQSKWSGLIYNTKENYEKVDNMLKDIDEEYRTTLINFGKYKLVMFAMAKLMEMETTEQNRVALYLFNSI